MNEVVKRTAVKLEEVVTSLQERFFKEVDNRDPKAQETLKLLKGVLATIVEIHDEKDISAYTNNNVTAELVQMSKDYVPIIDSQGNMLALGDYVAMGGLDIKDRVINIYQLIEIKKRDTPESYVLCHIVDPNTFEPIEPNNSAEYPYNPKMKITIEPGYRFTFVKSIMKINV